MAIFDNQKVSSVPRLVRLLNYGPFIRQRIKLGLLAGLVSAAANGLLRLNYRLPKSPPKGYRVLEVDRFDARFDSLWEKVKNDYPIMIGRKSDYLAWRYEDPQKNYLSLCIENEETGELLGYTVISILTSSGITRAIVVDLISHKGEEKWVPQSLIGCALSFLKKRKVDVAQCWMFPHAHFYPYLRKYGFKPRQEGAMNLMFRSLDGVGPEKLDTRFFADAANWYLTAGDTDWA
jgi:hypothetical protein